MGMDEYDTKSNAYDCLWLLESVKATASGADRAQYDYLSYIRALRAMTTCRQKDDESVETLQDKLMSAVQNFKLMGGDLTPEGLIDKELQYDDSLSNKEAAALVENKLIGIMMIESANNKKFDEYRRSLQNSMSEGHNR